MIEVMNFDFELFDESMDLLAPTKIIEPVEFFGNPAAEVVTPTFETFETIQPDLSFEEMTAGDQLLGELFNYIEPNQEIPEVIEDLSKFKEQDKVFETLQPVLDFPPEEITAPDQLLDVTLKQTTPEPKEASEDIINDVTTVITEGDKKVYILTLDSKLETQDLKRDLKRSKKVRISPYDKKERKRLQDAQAAQKYRNKKKEEQTQLKTEEQSLVTKRDELKSHVDELEAEVKALKKLMVERGFLPSSFKFYHNKHVKNKDKY